MKKNNKISSYLDYLYAMDYSERPVSMDEFICSDQFIGKLTGHGSVIMPVWKETLNDIAREDSKYSVVLTGAIGTGKSRTAIIAIAYQMHRILCLKDPWHYFGKAGGGKMAIVFFNLSKSLSESKGFNLLQSYIQSSDWFKSRGYTGGSEKNPRLEFPIFEYKLSSPQMQGFGFIGEDIILGDMDEVDNPMASVAQKKKVITMYDAAIRRFDTRFVRDGESIGRMFLIASSQEEASFLNTFIINMKGSKEVYIRDIAIWEAKNPGDYCGDKFNVMLGDIYVPPRILNSKEEIEQAIRNGFKIKEIPTEYKRAFELDMIGSLRDIAGISTSQFRRIKLFASESILMDCYDKSRKNPVKKMPIDIGLRDDIDLLNFIDLSMIRMPKNVQRCIHVDIAFTGDALGLAMSGVSGWSKIDSIQQDGTIKLTKLPVAETDFAMRLKAKEGDQIPIGKVHKLILDLKNICGFNIVLCTFDLRIASITSMQTLELAGIKCDSLSMDKNPQTYRGFRDVVNEGRWTCFYEPFLHFEAVNLEDDPTKNKIDHPEEVKDVVLTDGIAKEIVIKGSKDVIDGVAGSVMSALENCKTPPDIEIMKKLWDTATTPPVKGQDNLYLLDIEEQTQKPKDENSKPPVPKKDVATYKDILKRTMQ